MFHGDLKITLESDNINDIFHESDNKFMHKKGTYGKHQILFLIRKHIDLLMMLRNLVLKIN
jgi:hypothetical protein